MSGRCLSHAARNLASGSSSRLFRTAAGSLHIARLPSTPSTGTAQASRTSLPSLVRCFSSPTLKFSQSVLSVDEYHHLADQTLDALTDSLEELAQEYEGEDADDFEVEYSMGVLNLRLAGHGTYVINKQPPNKQIWFSSPTSGPKRFDFDKEHDAWFMLKDGEESNLRDLLNNELSTIFGKDVAVDLGKR